MTSPIAAVLLGYGLGFALLVPFGGLHLGQPKHPFVRCDVMGCKVVPAAIESWPVPSAVLLPTAIVPAVRVVPPAYVLLPDSVRVPAPILALTLSAMSRIEMFSKPAL